MSGNRDNGAQRSAILGRIRRSLGSDESAGDRSMQEDRVAARLAARDRGIVPARGQIAHGDQVELFLQYAAQASSSTERIASYDALPSAIATFLRGKNLPLSIRSGRDPRLADIDWAQEPSLERQIGPSDGSDLVGLSHAMAGVAETGTAIFPSGPDNPTTLNFLPETHVMVVHADDIVGDYETVKDRLRDETGKATMPRVLNMITGPSLSGDIEQTILRGAHGPRDVHVIVVG